MTEPFLSYYLITEKRKKHLDVAGELAPHADALSIALWPLDHALYFLNE